MDLITLQALFNFYVFGALIVHVYIYLSVFCVKMTVYLIHVEKIKIGENFVCWDLLSWLQADAAAGNGGACL